MDCTICLTNFLKTEISTVYQEIKRLTQELSKENFTKIIAHISKDVDLTNQIKDALDLFDMDEEKHNYLITFLNSIRAGMFSYKA